MVGWLQDSKKMGLVGFGLVLYGMVFQIVVGYFVMFIPFPSLCSCYLVSHQSSSSSLSYFYTYLAFNGGGVGHTRASRLVV